MKSTFGVTASWFGWSGVFLFVSATILGGMQILNYSHTSQLISESYAIGTPYGIYLRYFGFIPSGVSITVFSFLAIKSLPKSKLTKIGFLGVGIFYGIATVVVGLFPCDEGCNKELIDPSTSQLIHNLAGLLTYLIVPVSLIIIGIAARKWTDANYVTFTSIICGLIAVFFVGKLSTDLQSHFAGLYQRIIEGSILAVIFTFSYYFRTIDKTDSQL